MANQSKMVFKVIIGVPCSAPFVYTEFMRQFMAQYAEVSMEFMLYDNNSGNTTIGTAFNNHPNLPTNRNQLVYHAIKTGATHILFLDSDIMMPEHGLRYMLQKNLPIFGLLYFTRNKAAPKPIIYKDGKVVDPLPPKGLIQVDATGTGVCWWTWRYSRSWQDWMSSKNTGTGFSCTKNSGRVLKSLCWEKTCSFCKLARLANIPIVVDVENSCEHLTPYGVGAKDYWKAQGRVSEKVSLFNQKATVETASSTPPASTAQVPMVVATEQPK